MAQEQKPTANKAPVPYFSLVRDPEAQTADVYIFGDIASNRGGLSGLLQASSDQSSYDLANQVAGIPEDWAITVHINSNGGELKEGLGIYNVLKERNVTTICEGFAASAGSVIFAAGRRRVMQPASLLFIHQASMSAGGNSDDFAKYAADLKVITDAAVAAYKESGINITDEELYTMLKRETWITPEDAVKMGFATEIADAEDETDPEDGAPVITNDAMLSIMKAVTAKPLPVYSLVDVKDLTALLEPIKGHAELLDFAGRVLQRLDQDPTALKRIMNAVDIYLASHPGPAARAGNTKKGFFNFYKED